MIRGYAIDLDFPIWISNLIKKNRANLMKENRGENRIDAGGERTRFWEEFVWSHRVDCTTSIFYLF